MSLRKMRAIVVDRLDGPWSYEDVEVADPKENEVLVKILAVGICHSDEHGRHIGLGVKFPVILGHEGAGVVEKVGPGVTNVKPGDRVTLSFPYCGECDFCKAGEPIYCRNALQMIGGGTMPDGTSRLFRKGKAINNYFTQSSFAEYSVCHCSNVVKLEDDDDLGLAAPIGCGIQTGAGTVLNYLKPAASDTIAVYGCGCLGSAAIIAAKLMGCKTIIGVDILQSKLDLAKELGATHVINSAENPDITSQIMEITNGDGVNYGVDTTGDQDVITKALCSLAVHGELCIPAAFESASIPGSLMLARNLKVSSCAEGSSNPKEFIPQILKYYKEGRFPLDKLVSYYDFNDLEKAIDDMANGKCVKPVLRVGEF